MDIVWIIITVIILVVWIRLVNAWLKIERKKDIYFNYLKNVITFIILWVILMILLSLLIMLWWVLFNLNNLGFDFNINQSDAIRIILNIFQLLIISLWIFIWYFNYKELIRKNQWDHFPEIKIDKDSVKTIDWDSKWEYNKGKITQNFIVENISNNFIKIDLASVYIDWKKEDWGYIFKQKLDTKKYIWDAYIWSENNLILKWESINTKIIIKKSALDSICAKKKIKEIIHLNIVLELECHKITKYVQLHFINENLHRKNNKKSTKYKFYGFKYL